MSTAKPNKNAALVADQKAIQGVDKHFAKTKTLVLAGTSYTPETLKDLFQADIDATSAIDKSRAQLAEQVATGRTAREYALAARKALKAYVLGNMGAAAVQALEDFGMNPPKAPGPKTAKVKAAAATKALATREARHTMGKKQKLAITGATQAAAPAEKPVQVAPATGPAQVAANAAATLPN